MPVDDLFSLAAREHGQANSAVYREAVLWGYRCAACAAEVSVQVARDEGWRQEYPEGDVYCALCHAARDAGGSDPLLRPRG